ncbi:MAG TPA: hypothetical protein PKA41_15555, partial [Verrucomicrobiota bacterium]|nr:hypothetical protein [Verrucomicrobiota bacterium]
MKRAVKGRGYVGIAVLAMSVVATVGFSQTTHSKESQHDSEFTVKERGAHHKVWERIEYETRPDGTKIPHVHSYTELASGLSFLSPRTGQWEDADESFEVTPDGFALGRKTQHGVIVATDTSSPYSTTWTGDNAGSYSIVAKATD